MEFNLHKLICCTLAHGHSSWASALASSYMSALQLPATWPMLAVFDALFMRPFDGMVWIECRLHRDLLIDHVFNARLYIHLNPCGGAIALCPGTRAAMALRCVIKVEMWPAATMQLLVAVLCYMGFLN